MISYLFSSKVRSIRAHNLMRINKQMPLWQLEAVRTAGQAHNCEIMGDNDEYRMAIFSGRLEDWDAWKRDVESFIGAKDPEMADIIVGLIKSPSSGNETKPYDEKN